MSGFPTRPSRDAFGPTQEDDGVITDSTRYVGAKQFNLMFWQLAGMGVVSPRAAALLHWDSGTSTLSLLGSSEAWDPKDLYEPTPAHGAQGEYTLTYASTYPDQLGQSVATALVAGAAFVQELANYRAVAVPNANGYEVDIEVYDADAGTKVDASVFVLLW